MTINTGHSTRIAQDEILRVGREIGCAVIGRAFTDIKNKKKDAEDALDFIMSARLDLFIENWQLDLEASYIRKKISERIGHKTKGL